MLIYCACVVESSINSPQEVFCRNEHPAVDAYMSNVSFQIEPIFAQKKHANQHGHSFSGILQKRCSNIHIPSSFYDYVLHLWTTDHI